MGLIFDVSQEKMLLAYRRQPKDRLNAVWKALLHPNQSSLGSALIVSLRHVSKVGALTRVEMADFHQLFRQLESTLERTFGAALVNLSCERNWAYREKNPVPPFLEGQPNPHVHWHVVPRYRQRVRFMNIEWNDPTFGEPFLWRKKDIPEDVTVGIIHAIRQTLPIEYAKKG